MKYVSRAVAQKKKEDRGGVLVFGTDASLESTANEIVKLEPVLKARSSISTEPSVQLCMSVERFNGVARPWVHQGCDVSLQLH